MGYCLHQRRGTILSIPLYEVIYTTVTLLCVPVEDTSIHQVIYLVKPPVVVPDFLGRHLRSDQDKDRSL